MKLKVSASKPDVNPYLKAAEKINEEMKSLQEVVLQKLLWGTDMCIPAHYNCSRFTNSLSFNTIYP